MILAVIAMLAGSGDQPPHDARPVIWNNLRAGMTRAEVERLYPRRTTLITPSCPAQVNADYIQGRLASVRLVSRRSNPTARCAEVVNSSMIARYGDPTPGFAYENRACGLLGSFDLSPFGEQCRRNSGDPVIGVTSLSWSVDDVEIILTREEVCPCRGNPSPDSWSVSYRRTNLVDAEAASNL